MIFILNFLHILIIAAVLWAMWMAYKSKMDSWPFRLLIIGLTLAIVAGLNAPSYTPKGKPVVVAAPEFEDTAAEMQDNLRKPALNAEQRGEHINKRLNVIDKLNERKENATNE